MQKTLFKVLILLVIHLERKKESQSPGREVALYLADADVTFFEPLDLKSEGYE